MQHSPTLADNGGDQGHASAPAPPPGRSRLRRAGVLLLFALAAQGAGAARAQDPASPAPLPEPVSGAAPVSQAPVPEPIPDAQPSGGAGPWALGIILAIAAVAVGVAAARHLRKEREPLAEEGPFLVFAPPPEGAPPVLPRAVPPPPAAAPVAVRTEAAEPARKVAAPPVPVPAPDPDDALTVRIQVPAEGRLQFLPGALEVVQGHDLRREIRFPRPAEGAAEFTIGRTGGAPDRHVQLPAPTVSRLHARMAFAEGSWSISNLSVTNPLRVNGRELSPAGESVDLADGDRIEIGEVVLRYRGPAQ
jgi:hypothetical protein